MLLHLEALFWQEMSCSVDMSHQRAGPASLKRFEVTLLTWMQFESITVAMGTIVKHFRAMGQRAFDKKCIKVGIYWCIKAVHFGHWIQQNLPQKSRKFVFG